MDIYVPQALTVLLILVSMEFAHFVHQVSSNALVLSALLLLNALPYFAIKTYVKIVATQ